MTQHSCLVYEREWENGAKIQVLYWEPPLKPFPDAHPSDQIQLVTTDESGKQNFLLMNLEDIFTMMEGLSKAAQRAIRDDVPAHGGWSYQVYTPEQLDDEGNQ